MKNTGKIRLDKAIFTLWTIFAIYCVTMLYLLFLRRIGSTYSYTYLEYLTSMLNFVPFKNIYVYATTPTITLTVIKDFIVNILGNIIIFIPIGLFLPCLFKQFRTFRKYIFFMIISIIIIELFQLLFMLGICDIDDFILNIGGCIIGFGIWKIRFTQTLLDKLHFIR